MSGETKVQVSAWTADLVLAHLTALMEFRFAAAAEILANKESLSLAAINEKFIAHENTLAAMIAASDKATVLFEKNLDVWKTAHNDWQKQTTERERQNHEAIVTREREFVTNSTYATKMLAIEQQVSTMEKRLNLNEGRGGGMTQMWGIIISVIGAFGGAMAIAAWMTK